MGSNLPAKKYKYRPHQRSVTVMIPALTVPLIGDFNGTNYVDLMALYSQANRVGLRQGVNVHIDSVMIHTKSEGNDTWNVTLSTIPSNYISQAAWQRGFSKWMDQQRSSDVPAGKYADYKIWMNEDHRDNLASNNLSFSAGNLGTIAQTVDVDGNLANRIGEWTRSVYIDMESESEVAVKMLGTSASDCVGLIDDLSHIRSVVQESPVLPTEANTTFLENFMDPSIADALEEVGDVKDSHNDMPPYHPSLYIGEFSDSPQIVSQASTYGGGVTIASGFEAMCGLVRIDIEPQASFTAAQVFVTFNFTEGTYHGIHCERLI